MERLKKLGQIGLRLDPTLLEEVEQMAVEEDRTLAAMTRILVKEAVTARRKRKKPPQAHED